MNSDDKIPELVAVFVSILVCFPCFLCSAYFVLVGLLGTLNPTWLSQYAGFEEVFPSSTFALMTAMCSGSALVALVGGVALLIWGVRRLRSRTG